MSPAARPMIPEQRHQEILRLLPNGGGVGGQVVLILKDVIDRCLPSGDKPLACSPFVLSACLTIVAPGWLGAADTQVRPLRTPYSDVACLSVS